jgi:ribosomal protein S18 acetylase RimI-like enzyme
VLVRVISWIALSSTPKSIHEITRNNTKKTLLNGGTVLTRRGMNKTTNIRLAHVADLSEIASLMYESFAEYRSLYKEGAFLATTPNSDQLAVRMKEGPVWVAEHDGATVGTVSVVSRGNDLHIRGMAVLPKARGLRLGQLLLNQVEQFARERNCRRLVLSTTPFLHRAIRLYESTGFRRTDEAPHELFGTPLFTMAKNLVSPQSS